MKNGELKFKTNGSIDFRFKETGVVDVTSYNRTPNRTAGFSKEDFDRSLKMASRKSSVPVRETTKTSE